MVNENLATFSGATTASRLRNQPVQARSSARVERLLDATAEIVDEIGYERLTTAMVAERAGASIGTLYRYYPDRLAVLNGLRGRLVHRLQERFSAALMADPGGDIEDWMNVALDIYSEMYRTEPGFRAIRFGDPVDDELQGYAGQANGVIARYFAANATERFGLADTPELTFHFEVLVELGEALVHRAYSTGLDKVDDRFLTAFRGLAADYIAKHLSA